MAAAAAAEALAEEPSLLRPLPPEKCASPTDAEVQEERPEPKRWRARVAALENLPRAATAAAAAAVASEEEDDAGDGGGSSSSFSFHARSFSGVETTPKFGSFNPTAAQFVAFHLTPPPPLVDPAEDEADSPPPPAVGTHDDGDDDNDEDKGKDGNSH
ncbi:hypothetical protein ACQ4PT_070375 [Festuca glaucescens]